ncbi:Na(+)-translocating NADH-quinone reductase subunit C [Alteromonas lipolytica]|uniref:Na(+)-translocating NADH-quinone reductase subunit C n=1 Tax=Alteromonas lipolytica TaxID=1856405 RepID=A0A1E8FJX3_9ALTE|nr:Na(+)-translocating NADH-quinone reductase subunit C [Alteromonas lipolytica]OFI36241.1 Na(+)-translocating NADH-quinone reductase subunit C [Alteromonas lipolytica]GGF79041.1 Na(+)-translocating NADH-quinone reductase subunit C [Alteromonas lipolytica]
MSAKKESLGKTVGVVLAVCLVCSIIVAGSAVGLREQQQSNAAKDKMSNILHAAGLLDQAKGNIEGTYTDFVETRYVDLSTGEFVDAPAADYDMYKAAKEADASVKVENSNVGFQRRAKVASVYLVYDSAAKESVNRIILPVHGSGLWDLMYGFLALDADGKTVRELIYYQQKETPGLGGEVQNPSWQAKWDGKKLYNNGDVALEVKKNAGEDNPYAVDALSGATLTSNGVNNTVQYWVGENGFGPFLKKQAWRS